jgi:hypothetical protein
MLARARFETETPNVIDAGEDAPSPPSRQYPGCNSDNTNQTTPFLDDTSADSTSLASFSSPEDQRQQNLYTTSNKGQISKGIRINYTLESDEEPDSSPAIFDDEADDDSKSYGYPQGDMVGDYELQIRGKSSSNQHPPTLQQQQVQPKRTLSINQHDSERTMREARLFAAAMLNESERRTNLHNEKNLTLRQESSLRQMMTKAASFGGASRRYYDEISLEDEPTHHHVAHDSKRFFLFCRRMSWCRLVLVLMAIVVVVIILFGGLALNDVISRTQIPTTPSIGDNPGRLDTIINFLYQNEISTSRDLYDESTPQYQAVRWIATEDPEELTVPPPANGNRSATTGLRSSNNNNANISRLVQRYVLAVLYYAMNGEQWYNSHGFVTGAHECSWFETVKESDGETYAMGVTCNGNMQVRDILLRKLNVDLVPLAHFGF